MARRQFLTEAEVAEDIRQFLYDDTDSDSDDLDSLTRKYRHLRRLALLLVFPEADMQVDEDDEFRRLQSFMESYGKKLNLVDVAVVFHRLNIAMSNDLHYLRL
ncbi:hypothetical protein GQR58_002013 [Nymphon striatum]|nr:hypothetical protein GQR58_002013 [Nymphon striatum]